MSIADQLAARGLPELPEPLPVPVVDSHTHLDSTAEVAGLPVAEALEAARSVNVPRVVQIGCDAPSSAWAVDLASREPSVVAAIAIHPNDVARAGSAWKDQFREIRRLAKDPHVRAIGETGLDYYRTTDRAGQQLQHDAFAAHIGLAADRDLTLVIHDRDAHEDVLVILDAVGVPKRFIMHCFSGDAAFGHECLDRGGYLSFPGTITYKANQALREAALACPQDRLLVETDAPYLTPLPHRARRNASYLVPHTVRFLAALRDEPLDELCAALSANADAAYGGTWGAS